MLTTMVSRVLQLLAWVKAHRPRMADTAMCVAELGSYSEHAHCPSSTWQVWKEWCSPFCLEEVATTPPGRERRGSSG